MRNKKKLSLLTVVFIIISVFVGCRNNEVAKINKNMDEIIDEIKKGEYGGSFTDLIYVSKDKAILRGAVGVMVYDLEKQEIFRALDLKDIDMNNIQGLETTFYGVDNTGSKIIMFNTADSGAEIKNKNTYLYDIEKDKLDIVDNREFEDRYVGIKEGDYDVYRKYSEKYSPMEFGSYYGEIDDNILCFLGHDRSDKKSPLKLLIVNKVNNEEKLYDIF
ncbi:hypothetical protein D3C81_972300 [compost metagenome]